MALEAFLAATKCAGAWKYLSVESDEFLFKLARDERECANYAKREPKVFEELKSRYRQWEAGLPSYPDATFSVPSPRSALATPSLRISLERKRRIILAFLRS